MWIIIFLNVRIYPKSLAKMWTLQNLKISDSFWGKKYFAENRGVLPRVTLHKKVFELSLKNLFRPTLLCIEKQLTNWLRDINYIPVFLCSLLARIPCDDVLFSTAFLKLLNRIINASCTVYSANICCFLYVCNLLNGF